MTTPKTYKQSNINKKCRMSKTLSASESIGKIEKDTDTFILTFGQFSLIDALVAVIDQIGPAHVDISTWTAANAHLERTAKLLESSSILSLRMIVDRSFETRQPKYCYHMRQAFGAKCIRAIRTHAKFMVIRNDDYNIVIRTSMNLNENPRLENIEISESKQFADFFTSIVDGVFDEVKEDVKMSKLLELSSVSQESPYQIVQAEHIQRINTNEPRATHTITES